MGENARAVEVKPLRSPDVAIWDMTGREAVLLQISSNAVSGPQTAEVRHGHDTLM
jgi:hypothetical protein